MAFDREYFIECALEFLVPLYGRIYDSEEKIQLGAKTVADALANTAETCNMEPDQLKAKRRESAQFILKEHPDLNFPEELMPEFIKKIIRKDAES